MSLQKPNTRDTGKMTYSMERVSRHGDALGNHKLLMSASSIRGKSKAKGSSDGRTGHTIKGISSTGNSLALGSTISQT